MGTPKCLPHLRHELQGINTAGTHKCLRRLSQELDVPARHSYHFAADGHLHLIGEQIVTDQMAGSDVAVSRWWYDAHWHHRQLRGRSSRFCLARCRVQGSENPFKKSTWRNNKSLT